MRFFILWFKVNKIYVMDGKGIEWGKVVEKF